MGDSTNDVPTAMSTSALENKLKGLKEKSNKHSQLLTAKLASSQSGQNLLHIGTSLSSLPPDLHSLLTQLHPVVSSAESTEKQYIQRLEHLVQCGNDIRLEERRVQHAKDCAELYQDLLAAETVLKRDASQRRGVQNRSSTEDDEASAVKQGIGGFDSMYCRHFRLSSLDLTILYTIAHCFLYRQKNWIILYLWSVVRRPHLFWCRT